MACGNLSAAPMVYDATSASNHSVWFPSIGASNLKFENAGPGIFTLNGDSATLTGRVAGNGLVFDLSVTATGLQKADADLCAAAKYESGATLNDCLNHWSIFTTGLTGTLNEVGGSGRNYLVDIMHPDGFQMPLPQLGTNKANAKNNNYGFSSWIGLELVSCKGCSNIGSRYKGDINIDLHKVPEPEVLALFAAGLVGLGLTRRRKRQ